MTKMLAGGAAIAAFAAATPAAAQYYTPYNPYAYANQYGYAQPYAYGAQYATQRATQQCTAAVQARLNNRTSVSEIIGAFLGANTAGRVTQITRVNPNRNTIRVRGLASSGRMAGYGPYGVGAYGALGYAYNPDLKFSCSVDYRGYVRDVDISRR
jgi:hypothetical protein